jgi:hypothetical protein
MWKLRRVLAALDRSRHRAVQVQQTSSIKLDDEDDA